MRYGRTALLIRLLLQMQRDHGGLGLADIMATAGCSRRTAERLRDAMLALDVGITEKLADDGTKRWHMGGRSMLPGTIQVQDFTALERASRVLEREGDAGTAARLDTLSGTLRNAVSPATWRRLDPDVTALMEADGVAVRPGPKEQLAPRIMEHLREAILCSVWITADHRSPRTGRLSRKARLGPLGVILGHGRQYLVAFSEYQQNVRLFTLTGFEAIEATSVPFVAPEGFLLKDYLRNAFGVYQEAPQDIVWHFAAGAATEAARYDFHPSQQLEPQPDGSLIVRFTAGGLVEMAWHAFRWGPALEILEPVELRNLYQNLLRETVGRYVPI